MKKLFLSCAVVASLALSSCGAAFGPVGALYTDVTMKNDIVDGATLGSKVGKSEAKSYLGLIAIGDAGVEAAAKAAGIKKISHVDMHTNSILGIINTYTLVVYGE
ncbi:hypothetical protein D0T53_08160 [Dysgonomonas sp. 216]|uniref:TRL domain-containing protein n=1 Tax=Dysgonomonas sp. 216 TaxID=2302934 RepID=UPI0013D00AC6|nr:TRL domain-containing protein [Dysgonomonas sp. 216]NDW18885.1 hypothetical protein [Dysgonomonas sp. 216]